MTNCDCVVQIRYSFTKSVLGHCENKLYVYIPGYSFCTVSPKVHWNILKKNDLYIYMYTHQDTVSIHFH